MFLHSYIFIFLVKPTEVHINQLSPNLVADQEAIFECIAIGSRPKPIIYWLFNGKRHDTTVIGKSKIFFV